MNAPAPSGSATAGGPASGSNLGALRPLFGELNDLKRVRVAGRPGSLAEIGFARSWSALAAGEDSRRVALREVALALAAVRLGGIDAAVLRRGGLTDVEIGRVLVGAVDAVAPAVDPTLLAGLHDAVVESVATPARGVDQPPAFVALLATQPRAGATRPGHARVVLEPAESHAEHCYLTAVYAALAGPTFGLADPAAPFLAGLAHHLHNAYLPDSGFAGEGLLGDHLRPIMNRFTAQALAQLSPALAALVGDARGLLDHADSPEARAFHAGDVLDRVLQMDQYAKVAAFELRVALHDLDLVHPGPLLAFHNGVLADAGLLP